MKHAGFWPFGAIAALGMLAAGFLALRPHLFRKDVKIVSILPRTGSAGPQTDAIVKGIELALADASGVAGRFRVRYEDWDWSLPAGGSRASSLKNADLAHAALADSKVVAIIGGYSSTHAMELAATLKHNGLIVVSPSATDPELTGPGHRFMGEVNFFRVIANRSRSAVAAAEWSQALGAKTVHVLRDDDWGRPVSEAYETEAQRRGVTLVGGERINPRAAGDLEAQVKKLIARNPDIVFFDAHDPAHAALVAAALKTSGYPGKLLIPDTGHDPEFLALAGPAAEGVHVTSCTVPPPADFEATYRAKYGVPPDPLAYSGYVAAKAVLEAIGRVDRVDGNDVRRSCGNLPMFDVNGELARPPVAGYVVRGGRFEFVRLLR